jgi:hypothetical protein
MDRRSTLALAVVALLGLTALAGCAWLDEGDPPPTPGQNQSGDPIPMFRMDDHDAALAGTGYRIEVDSYTESRRGRSEQHVAISSDPTAERALIHNDDGNATLDRYLEGTRLYTRLVRNETTNYDNQSLAPLDHDFAAFHRNTTQSRWITNVYRVGDFERVGNVTEDGRTFTEFRLAQPALRNRSDVTIRNATGYIKIGADDVIYNATIDLRGSQDGSAFVYHVTYRVTHTGDVGVQRPDWLSEVPASSETVGPDSSTDGTATPERTEVSGE